MCNLHMVFPLNRRVGISDIKILERMMKRGAQSNRDAWGVSNGKHSHTEAGAYRGEDLSDFAGSAWVIGHNRLATQGKTIQPYEYKGYMLAHNGVFWGFSSAKKDAEHSDSALWLIDFVESINEAHPAGATEKEIEKALVENLSTATGSFSILLVHEGKVFYAKNNKTDMHFALIHGKSGYSIVCSTKKENIVHSLSAEQYGFEVRGVVGKIVAQFEPDSETIYGFDKKQGLVVLNFFEEKIVSVKYEYIKDSGNFQKSYSSGSEKFSPKETYIYPKDDSDWEVELEKETKELAEKEWGKQDWDKDDYAL